MKQGPETLKSDLHREWMYINFMRGKGIDIGYGGKGNDPVVHNAIGWDKDSEGFNDILLPFEDGTFDFVYSSHCLEHIDQWIQALQEWFRVLKEGGHLIITVPHQYLYERKARPPSNWNLDHKRFYLPWSLLFQLEVALPINSWRIKHFIDNDRDFDYSVPVDQHPTGCYELECVIRKIKQPEWKIV